MLLFYRGVSMLGPTRESCRYRCQPARGTLPVMTVSSPETPSVAGMGKCVWKYLHVHKSKGTCTRKKKNVSSKETDSLYFIDTQCTQKKWSYRDPAENKQDTFALLFHRSRIYTSPPPQFHLLCSLWFFLLILSYSVNFILNFFPWAEKLSIKCTKNVIKFRYFFLM